MTIRQIHDFGPAVGEYVCGMDTDIRATFRRFDPDAEFIEVRGDLIEYDEANG
jgi:hypothetical protein